MRITSFPNALAQVLINLLTNALEAIPEGGRIAIGVRGGRGGASLVIADNGRGIPERRLKQVTEPFFTTKGERGNGLGLWVAQSVMNELGGRLRLRSSVQPGRSGTTVVLEFPRQAPERPTPED